MRPFRNLIVLLFLTSLAHAAMDTSPVTQSSSPTPIVPAQQSPAVQDVVLQGTITTIDTVSQKFDVRSSTGAVQSFMMGTTTPITNHFTPIGFKDLQVGDHVVIHYSPLPYVINSVDKQ